MKLFIRTTIVTVAVLLGLSVLSSHKLNTYAQVSEPSSKIDWIMILGTRPKFTLAIKNRLDNGILAHQLWPQARILITGKDDEVVFMKKYLLEQNVSAESITEENQSTSTWTNFENSKKIIPNTDYVLIVTNEFHQRRSLATANLMGYHASLFGKDTVTLEKKWFYRIYELLSGIKWYLQSFLYKI